MKLFRLGGFKRLFLSLALSFLLVLILLTIFRHSNPTYLKPDYFSYLWDAILDGAGVAFVAIAAGLFLVLSTINQYLNEVSIGWKRLSIVSSFLVTLFIGSYSYLSQALRGDDMFLSLLAMPISMALLLYSKVIYAWIKDGFKTDKI